VAAEAIQLASTTGAAQQRLVVEGDVVRLEKAPWVAVEQVTGKTHALAKALVDAGNAGAKEFTLGQRSGLAGTELRAALQKLAREAVAVRMAELWFAAAVVDEARRRLLAHFASTPTVSVIQFKELAGLPRKQAVAMLEHFDQLGLTRRQGDARVLR